MGILDSIVEWIATQIMNLLDLVTGSVDVYKRQPLRRQHGKIMVHSSG